MDWNRYQKIRQKIISDRKGTVLECGTMTFYDGGVNIYWSNNGTNETYVVGMP